MPAAQLRISSLSLTLRDVVTQRSQSSSGNDIVVRDLWPRLLLSPIVGAVIPNLAGFIDNTRYGPGELLGHYLYFWAVSLTIWEGNRRLHDRFRSRFAWFEQPWMRVGLLLGTIILFTVPVTWGLLWAWGRVSNDPRLTAPHLAFAIVLTVMFVVVIAHVYETLFMFRYWERDRLSRERLERGRLQAELDALQRDARSAFSVQQFEQPAAADRNEPSACDGVRRGAGGDVSVRGRYARSSVGTLADELAALERQRVLAEIRFGDSVRLDDIVDRAGARHWRLPPLVLQELFENAVKHNAFDRESPLDVRVDCEENDLVVSNRLRPRATLKPSTKLGLRHLDERMRLAVGRPLRWSTPGDRFVVRVPLAQAAATRQQNDDHHDRQIAS